MSILNKPHFRNEKAAIAYVESIIWKDGKKKKFRTHEFVRHSAKEYVRDGYIHTNTIEGYFGLFKRGMKGIYQHCKSQHLKRYLCEFDFRYNNRTVTDTERAVEILASAVDKRLKYRDNLVMAA